MSFVATACVQVGTAVKETGKATAGTVKQGAGNAKCMVAIDPTKSVDKAEAQGPQGQGSRKGSDEVKRTAPL